MQESTRNLLIVGGATVSAAVIASYLTRESRAAYRGLSVWKSDEEVSSPEDDYFDPKDSRYEHPHEDDPRYYEPSAWKQIRQPATRKRIQSREAIHLVIKGNKKAATREAHRRGIAVKNCKYRKGGFTKGDVDSTTTCVASNVHEKKIAKWMGARGTKKRGRGFAPGTLLFYN